MPVRRRLQAIEEKRVSVVCFLLGDGTAGLTGDDAFATREAGRKAWPGYRRETWEIAHRGRLPRAAVEFDGLTMNGAEALAQEWHGHTERFDLARVLAAVDEDRAAVATFRARDRRGANTIRDYLDDYLASLDRVEAAARRIAAGNRTYPMLLSGGRYGDSTIH